ncbi:HvfB family MNIO-type RiPP peptide maturase [Cellvibrio sp. ARAG 10.3]|uniref:HvfB family MNIO-type RiPP peptide maturase n=1 Tax=Cellvibrio sp. ARAG 10.3 TaxID=3451358 RepID=UPI003F46BDF5
MTITPVHGAGLGLRRNLLSSLRETTTAEIQFMEVAPENWINVGGRFGKQFRAYTERFPFVCHGLSLSIGSPAPLNLELLHAVKDFLRVHDIRYYSEHLSYCSDDGQLYDLLPIPFTEEAVHYVAGRIRQAQDILEQRIAIENASYYCAPQQEMSESEFINAVINEADCDLLLDVNNVYVNSINHRYDPLEFLKALPGERTAYMHIAGHFHEAEDLRVDTHGAPVIPSVWALLERAYQLFGVKPTLLERDFNIPPLTELLDEVKQIQRLQAQCDTANTARPKAIGG